jgi:ABC-type bacteriocin/lantibiotic exporter with double-glycine peptidase domain
MIELAPDHIARTGDDTPARDIWGYVWRMSGWRQALLALLALAATLLNLAPVELQRRLIDDAITQGNADLLFGLGALYGIVLGLHQLAKLILRVAQGWLSESTALYTRRHLLRLWRGGSAGSSEQPGEAVAIIGPEVDKLAGFVGTGPSSAIGNAAMLLGVTAYMLWVDPMVAGLGLVLIVPQIVLTPLLQRRLNRLVERRVTLMRGFGNRIAEGEDEPVLEADMGAIYRNRMTFAVYKALMKGLLNLLNAAAPLALLMVGGWFVLQGETTVGVLVAFLSGFERLADPIRDLIAFYRQCAQADVQHRMIARWM